MTTRTPDWLVERLAAGELSTDEAAQTRARLEAEPGGLARLAQLEQSNRELLDRHPVAPNVSAIRRRAEQQSRPSPSRWVMPAFAGVALAAALAAIVLQSPTQTVLPREQPDEVTREKGAPRLLVHRQSASAVELLRDHSQARAGDRLQLSYVSSSRLYGAIVSIDGRGQVTQHWPEGGTEAAKLSDGGEVALPHGYVLDDAPDFERFVFLTSNEPFSLAALLVPGPGHTLPSPPKSIEQVVVQLEKATR